jgi:hypothetical protein
MKSEQERKDEQRMLEFRAKKEAARKAESNGHGDEAPAPQGIGDYFESAAYSDVAREQEADSTRDDMNGGGDHHPSRAVKFTYFDECLDEPVVHKRWIFKNVMAKGEISAWIAPPGAGKSALLADISVSAGAPRDWRGHRNKGRCGVIYFAFERADLTKRRLAAYGLRDKLRGLPIAVVGKQINFMRRDCVAIVLDTVREAEARFKCKVGLIVIDPNAKAIAFGGGDEDKARDQNILLANLRAIQEQIDVHIAGIGHTGKDESRGERGSNARLGDADVFVQITGDDIRTVTVTKANDQPPGLLTSYKLTPFDFGPDEDGDPRGVWIISEETFNGEVAQSAKTSKGKPRRLPGAAQTALRALREAVADVGAVPPVSNHVPPNVRTVTTEQWRTYAYKRGISSGEQRAREKAFERATERLTGDQMVGTWGDLYWPASKQEGNP